MNDKPKPGFVAVVALKPPNPVVPVSAGLAPNVGKAVPVATFDVAAPNVFPAPKTINTFISTVQYEI